MTGFYIRIKDEIYALRIVRFVIKCFIQVCGKLIVKKGFPVAQWLEHAVGQGNGFDPRDCTFSETDVEYNVMLVALDKASAKCINVK